MLQIPQRLSLVAQTVEMWRNHIAVQPAGEKLPGERELAGQLNGSRNTIRASLKKLEGESVVCA